MKNKIVVNLDNNIFLGRSNFNSHIDVEFSDLSLFSFIWYSFNNKKKK